MISAAPTTNAHALAPSLQQKDQDVKRDSFYLPELDGLRTCAFLYVFLFHAWQIPNAPKFFLCDWYNRFVSFGFTGVDFFFVLSGYLITYLLLKERLIVGSISFGMYFRRRMLRIWPLYYLALFVGAVVLPLCAARHLDWHTYTNFFTQIFLPMFFWIGNYALVGCQDALIAFSKCVRFPVANLFNPLWSVCIEEQFYLTWPWILKKANSMRLLFLAIGSLTAASIVSRSCFYFAGQHVPSFAHPYYYSTISRIDPLMAGAAVAVIQLYLPNLWTTICKYATPIAACGIVLLLSAISLAPSANPQATLLLAPVYCSIALAFGLILAGTIGGSPLKNILSNPWFANPGKITYGMYVVHHPIMVLTEQYMRQHTSLAYGPLFYLIRTSVSLALTYAVASLLWKTYESKFNAMRKRFARV